MHIALNDKYINTLIGIASNVSKNRLVISPSLIGKVVSG